MDSNGKLKFTKVRTFLHLFMRMWFFGGREGAGFQKKHLDKNGAKCYYAWRREEK